MKVSVVGSGSFGTAIAQLISSNVEEVMLFGRRRELINSINKEHVNDVYHPLIRLNQNINAYSISSECDNITGSDFIIICVPSGSVRNVAKDLRPYLDDKVIISTAKGIEYPSLKVMTNILKEEINTNNVFCISGPTFSDEMIRNALSGITIGINNEKYKNDLIKIFKSNTLLTDYSEDIEGVELCGVLKNVYAVAMGVIDSYFYSYNEHYTFLNLCFKEMKYILESHGHGSILHKFCAFGDFSLTTNADKSRNRTLGLMIGKDISLNSSQSSVTFESFKSAKAIQDLSKSLGLNTPIINFINSAIDNPADTRRKLSNLLNEVINIKCYD